MTYLGKLGEKEMFLKEFPQKMYSVFLFPFGFASIRYIKHAMILKVDWSRIVTLNAELRIVIENTQKSCFQVKD